MIQVDKCHPYRRPELSSHLLILALVVMAMACPDQCRHFENKPVNMNIHIHSLSLSPSPPLYIKSLGFQSSSLLQTLIKSKLNKML